jgi:hypothetical protein
VYLRRPRLERRGEEVEEDRKESETKSGSDSGDEGIFPKGEFETVLIGFEGAEFVEDRGGNVTDVAIMILSSEAGGNLLESSDVLAGLSTIDQGTFGGVANSHDEGSIDGGRHFGHAGGGDGIAIAHEEEGGGVRWPVAGDFRRFFEAIEKAGFAHGKNGGERKSVEEVEDDFSIAAFLNDGFRSIVDGDHGDVEFLIGHAFEEGLYEFGGALGTRESLVFPGVLKAHGGRNIDDKEKVPPLVGLDFLDLGTVGFRFD